MRARWQDRAACRGEDPELFFDKTRVNEAVAICRRCPVIHECGLSGKSVSDGVWGGVFRDQKAEGGPGPSMTRDFLEEHGSEAGYARHKKRDEEPCGRCRAANSAAWAERERKSPQKRKQRVSA